MSRTVSLILVDGAGAPTGALPPFTVDVPYWQEVDCVVRTAAEQFGVAVTVLRLLAAERPAPHGGAVTYLAQLVPARLDGSAVTPDRAVALDPGVAPESLAAAGIDLSEHPARPPYARPGGPAASLRWAARRVAELGLGPITGIAQQRTWNLSAIWRLDTAAGPLWLKQVPAFFAHEPVVLSRLSRGDHPVPHPLATSGGLKGARALLPHVPGPDLYGADLATRHAIVTAAHRIQLATLGDTGALIAAGVPDRRAAPLAAAIAAVVDRHGAGDPRLATLIAGLDERLAAVASCRMPDTLVHGDLHPGNARGNVRGDVRGDGAAPVIIDWGDSFIGHPAFDILRLTDDLVAEEATGLVEAWTERWRAAVPGCDPGTAVELLRPVAELRNAVTFADFLANIEPAEHPYHAADIGRCLAAAAQLAGAAHR